MKSDYLPQPPQTRLKTDHSSTRRQVGNALDKRKIKMKRMSCPNGQPNEDMKGIFKEDQMRLNGEDLES